MSHRHAAGGGEQAGRQLDPDAAAAALAADPHLGPLVRRVGPVELRPPAPTHFAALLRAICYQQLAGRAAAAIHHRVVAAVGGDVRPARFLDVPESDLRAAGLSAAKVAAVRHLAARAADVLPGVEYLPDAEVTARLTTLRGVGPWTADMFLIFQLRRADVWPAGDLGVRAGYARLHGLDTTPSPAELAPLGDRFRPWRSAAAWYCWRALEDVGAPDPTGPWSQW